MNNKYNSEDINKGFRRLAKLQKENVELKSNIRNLRERLIKYEAKKVWLTMGKMGFTQKEAMKVINMLKSPLESL